MWTTGRLKAGRVVDHHFCASLISTPLPPALLPLPPVRTVGGEIGAASSLAPKVGPLGLVSVPPAARQARRCGTDTGSLQWALGTAAATAEARRARGCHQLRYRLLSRLPTTPLLLRALGVYGVMSIAVAAELE